MATAADFAALQRAYDRSGLRRAGVTFTAALRRPALVAALKLGAAMERNPPPKLRDAKRAQAGDLEDRHDA